jgi:hypothetical protein
MDILNTDRWVVFNNLSHGLLSAQVKWANEYGQYIAGQCRQWIPKKLETQLQNKAYA